MTARELQIEVERRIQLSDVSTAAENKLNSDTIFSLINEAIDVLWKQRYKEFEQTQERTDELRNLVEVQNYSLPFGEIQVNGPEYSVVLPEDYVILLGDTVGILPSSSCKCWDTDSDGNYIIHHTDTLESTIETIDRQLANSLSEHRLKYCFARPLRLIKGNTITLYTDGKYKVQEYKLTYLRKPQHIHTNDDLTVEYTDIPEIDHQDIIRIAAMLYSNHSSGNQAAPQQQEQQQEQPQTQQQYN